MSNSFSPTDRCVCGHLQGAHDESGCVVCAAKGQHCPSFWIAQDYQDAVQRAQLDILQAERERAQPKRGQP